MPINRIPTQAEQQASLDEKIEVAVREAVQEAMQRMQEQQTSESVDVSQQQELTDPLIETETDDAPASSKELARRSQFSGLLTAASAVNASLNVMSRLRLAEGAYNAKVAGRVINFENQQKTWENTKRAVFLIGSTLSFAKVSLGLIAGVSNPIGVAAVVATTAGQAARIILDNKMLSGDRQRQDSNAEYHRMAYGNIVTRGNR